MTGWNSVDRKTGAFFRVHGAIGFSEITGDDGRSFFVFGPRRKVES